MFFFARVDYTLSQLRHRWVIESILSYKTHIRIYIYIYIHSYITSRYNYTIFWFAECQWLILTSGYFWGRVYRNNCAHDMLEPVSSPRAHPPHPPISSIKSDPMQPPRYVLYSAIRTPDARAFTVYVVTVERWNAAIR